MASLSVSSFSIASRSFSICGLGSAAAASFSNFSHDLGFGREIVFVAAAGFDGALHARAVVEEHFDAHHVAELGALAR